MIVELITRKRDGAALTPDEIGEFVAAVSEDRASDAQIAAMTMAILLRGMDGGERASLTRAMADSGDCLKWDLPGPVVDKHSTGGIGDKVSLMLAPLVAACGLYVPMISGRGLGHTGGTLDKLQAIPGFDPFPDNARFQRIVGEVGCAIIGQSDRLAPADRRIYAVRDTCGTVESIDLIVASILSKKLAAGLDALVMDIKVGSGSFNPTLAIARQLGEALRAVAAGNGLAMRPRYSDMDQPLGRTIGNALEVIEANDYLRGIDREPRLDCLVRRLACDMLEIAGIDNANQRVDEALASGTAFERWQKMVRAQGGDLNAVAADAPHVRAVLPSELTADGEALASINAREIGLALIDLGGGRQRASDRIDPRVGLIWHAPIGLAIAPDMPVFTVHAANNGDAARAIDRIRRAIRWGERQAIPASSVIIDLNHDS